MWWKLLVLAFAIALVFRDKELHSKTLITRIDSIDSSTIFKAYCDYFDHVGIKFPEVVTAQFTLETNFGTSLVYKENHNMFGMKCSRRRFALCEKNGHAAYANCADSVRDYLAYQRMMLRLAEKQGRTPHTNEEYMALLEDLPHLRGHRYATDPNYVQKLRVHLALLKAMG